ncbi:MAG: efflux RND transporter periplasmic adaptor subunit [bacterium]|nr:efflux RND transporter periplasmic adaptor subunit [bacterium]
MNPRTRNAIIVLAALVAVVVVAVFASHRGSTALPVKIQRLTYSTFTVKLPENGTIMHPQTATVPALVAGNLDHIYVKAGERVSRGQLLATLDNPTLMYNAESSRADYGNAVANVTTARINERNARVTYQAAVATQKSNLDEAQRVYLADVALLKEKAIARNQVDADKAKYDQALVAYNQAVEQLKLGAVSGYGQDSVQAAKANAQKAQIVNDQNQQQLDYTRIVAPFDGIIQTVAAESGDPLRSLQPGDAVSAGQALFTMASSTNFIVKAQVDEQDIINVRVGQPVNVTGQDFPGKTLHGHVAALSPVAQKSTDASSTAMQVLTTIELDESPSFLRDGMTADVDILTTDMPHALAIPNDAITTEKGTSYVYVVRGGVAKKTPIKLGKAGDATTLVTSGLAVGDEIVAQKSLDLTDGAAVTPLPSASPSASPAT